MRLFVISDTHGDIQRAAEIYQRLDHIDHIDHIVHLGDLYQDAKALEALLHVPVISVKGNMDGAFSSGGHQLLNTPFGRIFLAHGHMENVKRGLDTILYKAESLGCKAAMFGHTHVPLFQQAGDMYLLNPGSLALPVGGRKGSYAVVTLTPDHMDAQIGYEDVRPAAKAQPGTLSQMLNHSDRF